MTTHLDPAQLGDQGRGRVRRVVTALLAACLVSVGHAGVARAQTPPEAPADEPPAQTPAADAHTIPLPFRAPGWLEKYRPWVERWLDDEAERSSGFFPIVGFITSGSGVSGGAGYRAVDVAGTVIDAEATASISHRGYRSHRLMAGYLDGRGGTLLLRSPDTALASLVQPGTPGAERRFAAYVDVRHRDYPRLPFYGIGAGSQRADRADYRVSGSTFEGVLQARLTERVSVAARAGLLRLGGLAGEDDSYPDVDTRFAETELPGFGRAARYAHVGVAVAYERLRMEDGLTRGFFVSGTASRFHDQRGANLGFGRLAFDGRAFLPAGGNEGTIAARLLLSADLGGSDAVPFHWLQALGGGSTLRGFPRYRFRDRALAHHSVEYRRPVGRYVEVVPFLDVGTVAHRFRAISAGSLHAAGGLGVRFRYRDRVVLRVDLAVSPEATRAIFGTSHTF